jgi:hypothetical protein
MQYNTLMQNTMTQYTTKNDINLTSSLHAEELFSAEQDYNGLAMCKHININLMKKPQASIAL